MIPAQELKGMSKFDKWYYRIMGWLMLPMFSIIGIAYIVINWEILLAGCIVCFGIIGGAYMLHMSYRKVTPKDPHPEHTMD